MRKDKNAPTVPVETITYDYDADGLRVRRSWQGTSSDVTRFVNDGANVHVDLNSAGNVLVRYLRGDGVDQLFGRVTGISSSQFDANTGHWYMTDRLGSVIGIAQYDATGSDKWLRYRGFEVMPVCVCGPLKQTDRYEFTGREFDHKAVVQYNRSSTGQSSRLVVLRTP